MLLQRFVVFIYTAGGQVGLCVCVCNRGGGGGGGIGTECIVTRDRVLYCAGSTIKQLVFAQDNAPQRVAL